MNEVLMTPLVDRGDPTAIIAGQCDSYSTTMEVLQELVAKAENGKNEG
jgi:hypothetical protein